MQRGCGRPPLATSLRHQAQCLTTKLRKLIQSLAFHPQFLNDGTESRYKNWMAVASNEYQIHVWDLSILEEMGRQESEEPEILITPTVRLEGHLQRVIELDWSNCIDGRLLSISYDSSAQVWDLEKRIPLHNFQVRIKTRYLVGVRNIVIFVFFRFPLSV